ncbi:type IX secretion system ring subunit PorN/GldN [Arcticibacter eurypsychrophilus]|uniref:type IX secretion system ring protein PorN/GldN n=1 Tax=Arcticibacter eurypsychrophilus TaxID=1434752 RepID=UPI00084D2AA4|nr:gliding motility protein GldN [Arcticibacter eurypsychrophilus]
MKRYYLFVFFSLFVALASAQKPNQNNSIKPISEEPETERPVDGYYKRSNIENAKVTPYANLRDADVMFSKRVWREIDTRERMNHVYASPKSRLIDVIMDAVMAGELNAYDAVSTKSDPNGDAFGTLLPASNVMAKFADSVVIPDFNDNGEQIGSHIASGEFNPDSVTRFQIKEDWIFDKQRSVFEPRIIGIAPMVKIKAAGQDLGEQPAFWIYFPEARHIFATKAVSTKNNDATGLSYDDIFMKRLFSSYIVKESNPDDLRFKDYTMGIDRLYESERVKKALMDYEHDLWSY